MRFLSSGPNALLVELDDLDGVRALAAEVERRRGDGWAPGLRDVVPGARTLLLDGVQNVTTTIAALSEWTVPPAETEDGETVQIDCVYDGPDLADVARDWGMTVAEAIALHTATEHTVAFGGFAPGFAYIAGLPAERSVARRPTPRTSIPPGSVALAGEYTGIYPRASPGGWQLIGRTEAVLWDAARDAPALLVPGYRVRFRDAGGR